MLINSGYIKPIWILFKNISFLFAFIFVIRVCCYVSINKSFVVVRFFFVIHNGITLKEFLMSIKVLSFIDFF